MLAAKNDGLWCGQAPNGLNLDFQVKFNLEGQEWLLHKTLHFLTKVFYTSGSNLVILAWTGDKISCGQARDWLKPQVIDKTWPVVKFHVLAQSAWCRLVGVLERYSDSLHMAAPVINVYMLAFLKATLANGRECSTVEDVTTCPATSCNRKVSLSTFFRSKTGKTSSTNPCRRCTLYTKIECRHFANMCHNMCRNCYQIQENGIQHCLVSFTLCFS